MLEALERRSLGSRHFCEAPARLPEAAALVTAEFATLRLRLIE